MVYPIRYVVRNEVSKMRFIHMADIIWERFRQRKILVPEALGRD